MRLLIYLNIVVCCLLLLPQYKAQTYFNNVYDLFAKGDVSADIYYENNTYIVSGGGLNATQTELSLSMLRLSNTGLLAKSKHYFKNQSWYYTGLNHSTIKINDSLYSTVGYRSMPNGFSIAFNYLYKFNLDSISYKEYGYIHRRNVIYNQVKCNKLYSYMCGYVDSSNTNSDVLLIKTDTAGNEVWKKKIGVVGWDEQAYSIKTTQDGNLIIAGYKKDHFSTTSGDYILKVDTGGTVLWERFYSSANYASGSWDVIELPNGNYAFIGDDAFGNSSQGVLRKPVIGMLSSNGTLLWRRNYGSEFPGHDFSSMLLNKNGNIVACGQKGMFDNSLNGILYEVTQNGDSIFSREYYYQQGCQNYFRDIIQSSDGGYCLAGFFIPTYANGCTGSQDIWLLKIDSTFCEGSFNCGYPTGVHGQSAELSGIKVYPNPATNTLLLLNTIKGANKVRFKLYQANGTEVLQADVVPNYQEQSINISHLAAGVYYYQILADSQSTGYQKLVIIK